MLTIKFRPLTGNTAPTKRVNKQATDYTSQLVGQLLNALQAIGLSDDDSQALKFIAQINPDLVLSFAQCKTENDALAKFTHYTDFGEKRFYSVNNAPVNLFDLLGNLITGYRLYKANRLVSKQAEKPQLFSEFVMSKKLDNAVLSIPGVVDGLFSQYIDYLLSLQLSQGTILSICKQETDKRYKRAEKQVKELLAIKAADNK